jgi:hypothetical protein
LARSPKAAAVEYPLNQAKFQAQFNDLLRRMETERPHSKVRELGERITVGSEKIAKARAAGVDAEKLSAAEVILAGLKAERDRLNRDFVVPHGLMYLIWYALDQNGTNRWPLAGDGTITVHLPGIMSISVTVPAETPF